MLASSFSDLDFADDVALLAELLELLLPALVTMASEAASLGLELNWQKTTWARAELAEDKSPSFGQQGGRTTINHCSGSGGCNG